METPKIPNDEKFRLDALHSYGILDTNYEEEFDELTELASTVCEMPISLVTLIDEDRQWFKSSFGIEVQETPRDISFCAHAIKEPNSIFEVSNTADDNRFFDNPLVIDGPKVGFYAGVPLINKNGYSLGTLCVIDSKPNKLNASQEKSLKVLAKQAMNLIELRKKNFDLKNANEILEEKNAQIEKFAYHAAHDLKSPLSNIQGFTKALLDDENELNATQTLLLETIKKSSVQLKTTIDELLEFSRINSELSFDKHDIILKSFISDIQTVLLHGENAKIQITSPLTTIKVNKPALHAIFNNLLTNSIKYSDKEITEIHIHAFEDDSYYHFNYIDNGPGIDKTQINQVFEPFYKLSEKDKFGRKGTGLGLATVKNMVEKLGGKISLKSDIGKGVNFRLSIEK